MKKLKPISLDNVLLFVFIILILIQFYYYNNFIWLISLILLMFYWIVDLLAVKINAHRIKCLILGIFIFIFVINFTFALINQRFLAEKNSNLSINIVHDGVLQTEEAIKFFLAGKNPYQENYFGTLLEKSGGGIMRMFDLRSGWYLTENPVLYHFVYLPFFFLFSLPFYLLIYNLWGVYDQRIVYLIIFLLSLVVLYQIPKKKSEKRILLILFAFNPRFIFELSFGQNDVFVFFWLSLSLLLLIKKKYSWSAIILGLACASKQLIWPLIPFYFFYLFKNFSLQNSFKVAALTIIKKFFLPFIIIITFIVGPFLIWNFQSFVDDIYRYTAGILPKSFPIMGVGIAEFLVRSGVIKSPFDYFPFSLLQLIIGLPFLFFLLKIQNKNNKISQLLINYGLFLLLFLLLSRFAHPTYYMFISIIFILAYFIYRREVFDERKHKI